MISLFRNIESVKSQITISIFLLPIFVGLATEFKIDFLHGFSVCAAFICAFVIILNLVRMSNAFRSR